MNNEKIQKLMDRFGGTFEFYITEGVCYVNYFYLGDEGDYTVTSLKVDDDENIDVLINNIEQQLN